MLPACRTQGEECSIPPFDLTVGDVEGFLDELQAFHAQFRSCFARSEPREHFFRVCPTFYTGHFNRSVRLMLSTVICPPCAVTPQPPHKTV